MDIQQAPEIRAKSCDVDRGGAGDVDNNTPVYHDANQANMNAETDGMHSKQAARGSLFDPAQGAQLCLLAAKSPKSMVYKAYDRTRRARSFIPHWVVEYPWLEFSPEKECMFCIYCREYQKIHDAEFTNTFVHGATNFRLDSVKAHDNSTKHRQVMLVMSGKISSIPRPMAKFPRATGGGKGDLLRVGSFFDMEVNGGSYDVHGMGSAPHSSIHRPTEVSDDEGGQNHNIPSSSDLPEDHFYPPNPMAKYIKTLQNIYPHLPLNGVSSENCQTTNIPQQQPSQLPTPPSLRAGDAAPQGMEMENSEEFIKEEPLSPGQEEQAQGNYEREPGVEGTPSTSTGGGGKIGRAVPPMRKIWNVTTNGAASLSQEEDGGDQGNEYEQTGNDTCDHLDQDHEGEAAEGTLHQPGAMQDFFINPVVPVMRQGRRTTRLLPKAKRQKLEMIMARQMQGEDMTNISDDSSGDPRFHFDQEGDYGPGKLSSSDSQWKQLAESFATKYNQLSEAHSNMMKQLQSKITKLESKCKELEDSRQSRQRAPVNNSNQEDGIPEGKEASGSSQSSPRINMYSSVIVLQLKNQEPINISSTSDNNFSAVQENLSQSGIHISLGANNSPNTLEEQVSNHSRPVQRSLSKSGSPSTSSGRIADVSDDNVSRYSRTRDSNQVSGVGSTVQNDSEIQDSGHDSHSSDRLGYLMGNGVADGSAPSGCEPHAPGRIDRTSQNAVGDLSCESASQCKNQAVVLSESSTDCTIDQHSDEQEKVIASTCASSTADETV